MTVHSKPLWASLPYTCYELGHTWEPSCVLATRDVLYSAFVYSAKVYISLYCLTALLKRKKLKYYKEKLLPEILQSTAFLTSNGFLFIFFFCLTRKIVGKIYLFTSSLIPAIGACFFSILIERKQRRSMLALYFMNLASELVFNMLRSRNLIRPLPFADVLMFCVSSSAYIYLLRYSNDLDKSIVRALGFLLGANISGSDNKVRAQVRFSEDVGSSGTSTVRKVVSRVMELVRRKMASPCGCTTNNAYTCAIHALLKCARSFLLGYVINVCIKGASSVPSMISQPLRHAQMLMSAAPFKFLLSASHLPLAMFLGSYTGIYWLSTCMLKHTLGERLSTGVQAAITGALAGISMLAYRSTSVSLYLLWKLLEVLYFKYAARGLLPTHKNADVIIYTLSMSVLFHAAVFEPHNIRRAYWKFLINLTGGRFHDMNRKLLDVYGTKASKLYTNQLYKYDLKHIINDIGR